MLPDGWKNVTLGELVTHKKGCAFSSSDFSDGGRRVIRISDTNATSVHDDDPVYLPESKASQFLDYSLSEGDIILTTVGSRPHMRASMVGKVIRIPEEEEGSLLNQNMVRLSAKQGTIDKDFLYQAITTDRFLSYIPTIIRGNANQVSITLPDIFSYKILLPTKVEQIKIAEIILNWGAAIDKISLLIDQKQKQKKALMQRLLTGKHRFPEFEGQEWKKQKLSEFLIPTLREEDKPKENYLAIGIRSHCKGTFQKPDFDPAKIAMEKLYTIKKDDLIINITFAWEGAIALVKEEDEGGYVSHRFPTYVFNTEKAIPEFFRYVIASKRFRHILDLISPGGAGRNRVLSKKEFVKIEWPMPSVPEQQKIAAVLNAADKEIDLLTQKLEAYQDQKKGLMQQLLTGKKRVKLDRKEAA